MFYHSFSASVFCCLCNSSLIYGHYSYCCPLCYKQITWSRQFWVILLFAWDVLSFQCRRNMPCLLLVCCISVFPGISSVCPAAGVSDAGVSCFVTRSLRKYANTLWRYYTDFMYIWRISRFEDVRITRSKHVISIWYRERRESHLTLDV
jgi:hypothetical protein